MASTIKVNNIQNQCGANIINESANTITIGASGDTISLAAGASQTGFGRTGTVDWDTTAKTTNFTAVSGNGYFVNTTSGAITVTLPAGSGGSIVAVSDYASTAQTNNITISPNGTDKINGVNNNYVISTQGLAVTLVYVDATKGWKSVTGSDADATGALPLYVTATGGTITTCGDYKIHTFTGPGTFCVSCAGNTVGSNSVDYLVVAGGGSGGASSNGNGNAKGGGGAGGYRESSGAASGCYTASPLGSGVSAQTVTATAYPIVVGGGGTQAPQQPTPVQGNSGSNSSFASLIVSAGGGGGGAACGRVGCSGGSGGGTASGPALPGGAGNTPPVSPPQGNPGGAMNTGCGSAGSGGGGASQVGSTNGVAAGGDGVTTSISGSATAYGGGGGGGRHGCYSPWYSCRSLGGGGRGQIQNTNSPDAIGTANTGGGGGGGGSPCGTPGAAGGSGIVIIRYKFQN